MMGACAIKSENVASPTAHSATAEIAALMPRI
jgi:hypothetical protein